MSVKSFSDGRAVMDVATTGTSRARNEAKDEGERGVVINTASVAAFDGRIGQAAYSASKGEPGRAGPPRVHDRPGAVRHASAGWATGPARVSLGKQEPFPPPLGRSAEYGALAAHIVENAMLNGETIRLDGAIRV